MDEYNKDYDNELEDIEEPKEEVIEGEIVEVEDVKEPQEPHHHGPDGHRPPPHHKGPKHPRFMRFFPMIIIIMVVISLGTNVYLYTLITQITADSDLDSSLDTEVVSLSIEDDYTEMIAEVSNAVVGVAVYSDGQMTGSGSGVVYDTDGNDVYIITNHHVIEGAESIQIVFADTSTVEATLIGSDEYSDIAVMKVTVDFEVSVIEIGDSDTINTGETVFAIGSPLGIEYAGTVTKGIISATDRTVSVDLTDDGVDDWDMNVIQTDAAINPGNSGGAFVNAAGQLIGITSMKFSDTSVEGMGFCLPINDVMEVVAELLENGEVIRPVLGISGVSLDGFTGYELSYYRIDTDLSQGIYVVSVIEDGAAKNTGMEAGDIIVEFDGVQITTYKSFITALYNRSPGDTVEVVINRDGQEYELSITLE
ncbi:S1C family serine protease [Tannockella kyphosi]|uniref:S1C family serine protease n=1 Tax=Tannockella kyphosi TaxID=2899121 RepID=UPI00201258E5|nr:trypsin-like peptidase domain-containing protein [Tannockella kyphosi]